MSSQYKLRIRAGAMNLNSSIFILRRNSREERSFCKREGGERESFEFNVILKLSLTPGLMLGRRGDSKHRVSPIHNA